MQVDLLTDLKRQLSDGLITKLGYVAEAIAVLQLADPMRVDRQWLADQLGLTYSATSKLLFRLKERNLL